MSGSSETLPQDNIRDKDYFPILITDITGR